MNTTSDTATLPDGTRIGRSALVVNDVADVTDFYRDVVGLDVIEQSATGAVLGAGETPLLVLEGEDGAQTRHRSATGLYHNAFRVPSRAALGDALTRIRDHWQLGGASDHLVSEALYLSDPEGNGVEIYRDFPREEWPVTDDGGVKMATDPLDLDAIQAASAGEDGVPDATTMGHVHLEVSSLEVFESFYTDILGFETMASVPGATFVSAGGYHHHIGANVWHHRSSAVEGRGLSWFEILLPEETALDALRERLDASDAETVETDEGLTVTDVDGIEIRLRVATDD